MRGWAFIGVMLLVGGSWMAANQYADLRLRTRGEWRIEGEGPLWDSSWAARHIEAHGQKGYGWNLWSLWVDFQEQQLFAAQALWIEAKLAYCLRVRTRMPLALIRLPGRMAYVDSAARLLPCTRPQNLPIIDMPRWDSTAVHFFLGWWREEPLMQALISHLLQDSRGVWCAYTQIFPETFVLGRTEDLHQARRQWELYHTLVRPALGSNTCKTVLLHIPGQIVCQKS